MTISTPSAHTCPQPTCGGDSQVEDTRRASTWYVKRVRACVKCGHTWSTAEVPFPMLKRVMKVEAFIHDVRAAR